MSARGITSVMSDERPECHAPSGYRVNDYSAKAAKNGVSPRDRVTGQIIAAWAAAGIARFFPGGANGGGEWRALDAVNGGTEFLPFAGQGEDMRGDRIVFSHVIPSSHGGAYCACNILPEAGSANHARGDVMPDVHVSGQQSLEMWPTVWASDYARPASLARLDAHTLESIGL